MILIKNVNVYDPAPRGCRDILIGGCEILAIEKSIDPGVLPGKIEVLNANGLSAVPGFIDGHQHFTGGGGEGGFHTRTPEMSLSDNTAAGVTTAVGLLGTDSLTRSVKNLYAKTKALNNEGMTTFMLTGSYWLPSPTITGNVARDVVYIDAVIGVKLAMSDHRGPHYGAKELAVLASDVRVAALISGKPGIITVHTGINSSGLDLIFEVVNHHFIRPGIFVPTHINKRDAAFQKQVFELAKIGAFIDATGMIEPEIENEKYFSCAEFAVSADKENLLDRVCFSSDAGGSMPKWSEDKSHIVGMDVAKPDSLLAELKHLVKNLGMPLEKALTPLTVNPAKAYGLSGRKGEISVDADADILLIDPETFTIRDVLAKGKIMMRDTLIERKGYFE